MNVLKSNRLGLAKSVALSMLTLLALTACVSTRITNAWQDPQWSRSPYKQVLVLGVATEPGVRRTYESAFADKLREQGIEAVPGYTLLPEDGPLPEERIKAAVAQSKADSMLITRLVRVDRRTSISPGYYAGYPGFGYWGGGFYGFYSAAWAYPPSISQYDVVTLETNLWDAKTNKIVWSGMTETSDSRSVNRAAIELADVLVKEMSARGVLGVAPPARK